MTYFIMESPVGPGKKSASFLAYNDFLEAWISGTPFKKQPPQPIKLTWDPETEKEIKKAYYENGSVLMRKELVTALQEVGVDNLTR